MADQVLVQPISIASQVVHQTNLNVQQAREALEQAREADIEEAINNPNPERAPIEASDETGVDVGGDSGDQESSQAQNNTDRVDLSA